MKLKTIMAVSAVSSLLLGMGLANAASVDNRLTEVEGAAALNEEAIAEMRDEMERAMDVSGYADVEYIVEKGKDSRFRMHHLSLFFQKKLTDKWKFFSEIEFEDAVKHDFGNVTVTDVDGVDQKVAAGTANGKIFVEAVNFTYQYRPEAMLRVGRMFTPAGIWSIDHYPPFVSTQERPKHIRKLFPQLIDGVVTFGTVGVGPAFVSYDAYFVNGDGNTGKGDKNQAKAYGGRTNVRLELPVFNDFEVGGSYYHDPKDSSNNELARTAIGAHGKVSVADLTVQTEGGFSRYVDASDAVQETRSGYYVQAAYTLGATSVGYRYDTYDKDRANDTNEVVNSVFANYRFSPSLVGKVEYHMSGGTNQNEGTKTVFSLAAYLD